jgi:predicted kinase
MQTGALIVIRGPIGAGKTSVSRATYERMADHASIVETDAIKRMIDPTSSSDWRRDIAHASAAFIIESLLQVPRTGIIEVHTKYPAELDKLRAIAERYDAPLISVLLTAPLETCQQRVASRLVPDIAYTIDREMVADYYCNLEPLPGDVAYDTTQMSPSDISSDIVSRLA